ncbi:MFS transporter [Bacillus sp. OTU530]|uniref:MFS transporter n=1 Tax=Bacillus sp. OTU530 TaxID=3043862 RepID=UPI00406C8B3D
MCFALFTVAAVETVHSFSTAKTNATYQTMFASVTSGIGSIIGNSTEGLIIDYFNTAFLYFILFLFCSVSAVCYGAFHISSRKYSHPVEQSV